MIPSFMKGKSLEALDKGEAARLVRRARRGDERAKERLVLAHSRLIAKIVLDVHGAPSEDLFQEGVLGLFHAIERYRTGYRTKFSTYATYWIRYYVQKAVAGLLWEVRIPVRRVREVARVRAAEERLSQRLGRRPTDAEVARLLGWKADRLARIRRENLVFADEWDVAPAEGVVPSPLESYIARETTERLTREVSRLTPGTREVVILRYGLLGTPPATFSEIGRRLGISAEAVRQAERRALERLRNRNGIQEALAVAL